MQVLSSRVLLRPRDYATSLAFYRDCLGLCIYREFSGGTVFFLGGGFLEISRRTEAPPSDKMQLWLQVPDVDAVFHELREQKVEVIASPVRKPWGLIEMTVRDPDGVVIVVVEVPEDHPLRRHVAPPSGP